MARQTAFAVEPLADGRESGFVEAVARVLARAVLDDLAAAATEQSEATEDSRGAASTSSAEPKQSRGVDENGNAAQAIPE